MPAMSLRKMMRIGHNGHKAVVNTHCFRRFPATLPLSLRTAFLLSVGGRKDGRIVIPENLLRETSCPGASFLSTQARSRRADLLVRLGLKRSAYDWRASRSQFEEEIFSTKTRNQFFAFERSRKCFRALSKHKINPKFGKPQPQISTRRKDQLPRKPCFRWPSGPQRSTC